MTYKAKSRPLEKLDRETALRMLSDVSKKMYLRLSASRFNPKESDDEYLKMCRVWVASMQTIMNALKDEELTNLEQRLELLEEEFKNVDH